MTEEQWKPVVGYEGLYEVSDHGRVRSVDRVLVKSDGRRMTIKGKLLKGGTHQGYVNHKMQGVTKYTHVMVLEAFDRPRHPGEEARHLNDIKSDNRLINLRWGSRSDNAKDRVRNGIHNNAKKTHCPQGHEYTPENTYVYGTKRVCKTCIRIRDRERSSRRSVKA